MRRMLAMGFVAVLTAGSTWAGPLAQGTFEGKGNWQGPGGSSGSYAVETTVAGDVVTSRYVWSQEGGDRKESATARFVAKDGPFFDVVNEKGEPTGSGFCVEDSCHYRVETGSLVIEETIRFSAGSLEKLGAKKGPGFQVAWKETLKAKYE